MKRVHKYGPIYENTRITLPVNIKIISVAKQNGRIYFWAITDLDERLSEVREFIILGTGWNIPDDARHIGTVHDQNDADVLARVWHLFEVICD